MRHTAGQTDVRLSAERRGRPIGCDIGKVPLQPDIQLITGMAMVGKRIVGRQADERFAAPGSQIPPEERDLWTGGNALTGQRFPDDLLQVDNGLILAKGQRMRVRGPFVLRVPWYAAEEDEHDREEDNRQECCPWRYAVLCMESVL